MLYFISAPAVPQRYITPKLVVIQSSTLKKRAKKCRPKRVAPPPPKQGFHRGGSARSSYLGDGSSSLNTNTHSTHTSPTRLVTEKYRNSNY